MTMDEFKRQNPAYKDVPDKELAEGLYRNVYAKSGITKEDFYDKIGLSEMAPREETFGSIAKRLPSAFNRGIGNTIQAMGQAPLRLADMPVNAVVDAANLGLEAVGADARLPRRDNVRDFDKLIEPLDKTAPSQAVNRTMERLGDRWGKPPRPAAGAIERGADYVGELAGASLPFALAPYAGAARMAPAETMAPAIARTLQGRVWQGMKQQAANAPGRTATAEALAITGGGVGGAVARENFPDSPTAELAGNLIGGGIPAAVSMTPTVMGARFSSRLFNRAKEYTSSSAQTARAEQQIRDSVGDFRRLEPDIADSQRVEGRIDEGAFREGSDARMKLSLAERTGSPALVAAQRDMQDRMSGPTLDAEIARRQANEDAISAFSREVAPKSTADADGVMAAAASRGEKVRLGIDSQATRTQMEREALAGRVPTVDLAQKGRALRDNLDAQRLAVRDRFDARATADGLDKADVTVNFQGFQQKVAEKYAPKPSDNRQYRPAVMDDIARQEGVRITFQDAKNWRERITTDLRVAQRSNNPVDRERAKALSGLLRDFDDMIVNTELKGAAPDVAAKWSAFRKDYKDQYVDVFRPPQVRDVRARDIDGFEQMADEAVAAEVFKPGNVTTARRFKVAVQAGDDDMAYVRSMEAVESVAMDSLSKAAVRNGVVDQAALATWKRNHASMLDEFPFVRAQVNDLESANGSLIARQAQLDARKRAVERSVMERKLASVESGARTAESVIDDAVRNPAVAQKLGGRLRSDQNAMNGVREAVWQKLPMNDPDAALKFLADHKKSLGHIFTPEHLENIRLIAQARAMANRVPAPAGQPVNNSPFKGVEDALGSTLPSLAASVRAVERGRSSTAYEVPARVIQWWRARSNKVADEAWGRALYDPEVARAITNAQRAPTNRAAQDELKRTLWLRGLSLDPEQPNARLPGMAVNERERRPMVPERQVGAP